MTIQSGSEGKTAMESNKTPTTAPTADYLTVTNLAKLRIAENIMRDTVLTEPKEMKELVKAIRILTDLVDLHHRKLVQK
jgi:hypothetical protein